MPQFRREDIVLRFGGEDSALGKVIARVRKRTEGLRGHLSGIGETIQNFFSVRVAGGISAVGLSFAALAKSALQATDELGKTASKIGVTAEQLQELRHAASTAGVAQGTLDTALQRFSRRLGEAAQGTGVLYKELDRLGISVRDSDGNVRETIDVLGDYANAVMSAESAQEQLRLSFVAFDSEGAGMVNLLRQGKIAINDLREAAHRLGVVIDNDMVQRAEEMNQAWEDLMNRMSTRWQKIVLGFASAIDKMMGNYRTQQDVLEQIAITEEKLARIRGEGRTQLEQLLNDELRVLKAQLEVLKEQERLRNAPRPEPTPPATPLATPSGTKAPTSGVAGGLTNEPIELSQALAMQHEALQAFRQGGTQADLVAALAQVEYLRGQITQKEAEAKAAEARVAYAGTEGDVNLTGPGPGDQITVALGPDKEYLNEQFKRWAEENEIEVKFKVNPELMSLDLIYQTPADQTGAQE